MDVISDAGEQAPAGQRQQRGRTVASLHPRPTVLSWLAFSGAPYQPAVEPMPRKKTGTLRKTEPVKKLPLVSADEALEAVLSLQRQAVERGLDKLSDEALDAEIEIARRAHRRHE